MPITSLCGGMKRLAIGCTIGSAAPLPSSCCRGCGSCNIVTPLIGVPNVALEKKSVLGLVIPDSWVGIWSSLGDDCGPAASPGASS